MTSSTPKTYAVTPDHQWVECVDVDDPKSENPVDRVRFPTSEYTINHQWTRISSAKDKIAVFVHPFVNVKTAQAMFAVAVFEARAAAPKKKRPRPLSG